MRKLHGLESGKRVATKLLAPLILGACTFFSAGTCFAAESEPTVVIGYENLGATPEMVAITKGWFRKYMHAHVVLKEFASGPAALTALASGTLQFMTEIGNPPVAAAISRGVPLQVIWNDETFTTGEGLVVQASSGIKSLADLTGRKVAIVAGSSSDYVLSAALAKAGIDRSGIHFLNMSPPSMSGAWLNHDIDAAFVWTPILNQLSDRNGKIVFTDAQASAYAPSLNVSVVNSVWAKAHPDLVVEFLGTQNAAVQFTRTEKANALKAMATGAGISEDMAAVELSGIRYFDAHQQMTQQALGIPGQPPSASAVGIGLDSALDFLQSTGIETDGHTQKPSASINETYVNLLLEK